MTEGDRFAFASGEVLILNLSRGRGVPRADRRGPVTAMPARRRPDAKIRPHVTRNVCYKCYMVKAR